MPSIDLRSDTITQPTPAMRRAMAEAEVGDDVLGDDPTVIRLEEMAARRLGKEAGLFVASGTMGNLVSIMAQCGRGDEVIVGDQSHTYLNEQGGIAALGGIVPRVLRNLPDGTIDPQEVAGAVRGANIHHPRTKLVAVENTHNRRSGAPLTPAYMRELGRVAHSSGLRVHVDGARVFNAAVALRVDVKELAADADSITFCLSKGLAAPVGSVVCGERAFVLEARRARKVLGGGMRQAGVIAAAGIVALDQMVDRLAEDHANAALLAAGLAALPGIEVEEPPLWTNIVYFRISRSDWSAPRLAQMLGGRGVRILATGPQQLRAVTNYHVSEADIREALSVMDELLG